MRKLLLIMILFTLLFHCCPAWGENMVTVYLSGFGIGTDGWVARSEGSAKAALEKPNALHISGREKDWNSLGRDFALVPGVTYRLSVQVLQHDADSARFIISVAHSNGDQETYENLAFGEAARDQWVTLEGDYTAGWYDRFVLYVETTGAPELDFSIRLFRIEAPEGTPSLASPSLAETLNTREMPSLKDIWAGCFDFGTCVPGYLARNNDFMAFIQEQFSILTPENELKPDAVLDVNRSRSLAQEDETAVAVHFDSAQPLLDYALKNGIKVHGHVLVWHSQTPEAFFHEGYDPARPLVSREIMLLRLEHYIQGVMEYMQVHYPGVIVSWDVVNEAIDDGTGRLRDSNWMKTIGEDFVARAFELARRYAPEGTKLFYNDYNTALLVKQNGIVRLLESLIPEGNIDGYGFQMHHSTDSPTLSAIEASVQRIAALGLELRVSELDIGIPSNSENDLLRQAQMYARIMEILKAYSDQFIAVQVWGVCDNQSWRSGNYPLLFDASRSPKPAFWAVADPSSFQ